jgi:PhnB protein
MAYLDTSRLSSPREAHLPVEEQFWGDRYGVVVDPFGHSWALVTPVRQLSVEEMKDAMPATM